jgi:hypothetical protein
MGQRHAVSRGPSPRPNVLTHARTRGPSQSKTRAGSRRRGLWGAGEKWRGSILFNLNKPWAPTDPKRPGKLGSEPPGTAWWGLGMHARCTPRQEELNKSKKKAKQKKTQAATTSIAESQFTGSILPLEVFEPLSSARAAARLPYWLDGLKQFVFEFVTGRNRRSGPLLFPTRSSPAISWPSESSNGRCCGISRA